jgi:FAD/FMN-containing dehydrogenase
MSMHSSRAISTSGWVHRLRSTLDGRVIGVDDAGYDQARAVFYGKFDRRPAVIVRPTDAGEVARVVTIARELDLELAVRSGGHSLAGHSTSDGGIVLDLADMRALEIDPARHTAWAGTGLTAGRYTAAAAAHALATGFGDTASVGIGGLTLGGGIGFLVRKHGLTIDNLLAAELVTADGELRRADPDQHPDLFWAIRGGGGNFGLATRLQFRLHPLESIVGGLLVIPATAEVIEGFIAAADAAPDELSAIANIMVAPPIPELPEKAHGQLVIMALLCYAGDPTAGERVLAPFRQLNSPLADMVGPMPYPQLYQLTEGPGPDQEVAHSLFLDAVDHPTAEAIVDHLRGSTAPIAVAQLRVLGGAMARVPAEATAFAHRGRRILAAIGAVYEQPDDTPTHQAWVDGFAAALAPGTPGVYVGFLGSEGHERVREAYPGTTWDRLVQIKNRYDPTNLFRLNQNIPPSTR